MSSLSETFRQSLRRFDLWAALAAEAAWSLACSHPGAGAFTLLCATLLLLPWKLPFSAAARRRANDACLIALLGAAWALWAGKIPLQGSLAIAVVMLGPGLLLPRLFYDCVSFPRPEGQLADRDGGALALAEVAKISGSANSGLDGSALPSFAFVAAAYGFFVAAANLPPEQAAPVAALPFLAVVLASTFRRKSLAFAACTAACVVALAGGFGLGLLQTTLEDFLVELALRRPETPWNANSADTSIGKNGRNSLSGKLLWRLDWSDGPGYLRRGAYSFTVNGSQWTAGPRRSGADRNLVPNAEQAVELSYGTEPRSSSMKIAKLRGEIPPDKVLLPLPSGTRTVYGIPGGQITQNFQGAVTVSGASGLAKLGIAYDPDNENLPPPGPEDLQVPEYLENSLDPFISELPPAAAAAASPDAKAAAVKDRFAQQWTYTLNLNRPDGYPRTLGVFLTRDKRGHCEYFASASALLLRRMGVPTRYATGFLVDEYDAQEGQFWIRAKHSHAWTLYWDGSKWRALDSTPSSGEDLSVETAVGDFFSKLQYRLDELELEALLDSLPKWPLALALVAYLAWRSRQSWARPLPPSERSAIESSRLSRALTALSGLPQAPMETPQDHWDRIGALLDEPLGRLVREASAARIEQLYSKSAPDCSELLSRAAVAVEAASRRRALQEKISIFFPKARGSS